MVLRTARRLFAERGYQAVTIREVAAESRLSPAMVMKLVGSKERLYHEARPMDPAPFDDDLPHEMTGRELVRRVLDRREQEAAEPWARAIYLTLQSPDPERSRLEFRETYIDRFVRPRMRGDDRQRAEMVACLLMGLAAGARTLRLLDPAESDLDGVVARYGDMVQSLLDG